MPGFLPFIASFIVGFVVFRLTGSPALGQAAGLFALSATVIATGTIRLSGLTFDGSAARIAGVGIGVVGLVRLYIDVQVNQSLALGGDTGGP